MSRKKLVLVDGHSLAYRAFHALPPDLRAPSGELTNASYGFTMMLLTVLEEEKPDYVIVAFDKGPSFRVRQYAGYKAHRERMPDEMRVQMTRIHQIVDAFGIPSIELDDYEADDLLGTLSRQAGDAGLAVVIVTGDRDALQLVDANVTVLTSGRRFSDTLRYTPDAVRAKYGLEPQQLIDLKALIGDTSDNIPGVKGVGEKGATKFLQDYETLDGVYEHLGELPARYQKALEEGRDDAYLSRELGLIVREAPVTLGLDAARMDEGCDRGHLVDLMQQLGFRTLVDRLPLRGETVGAGQGAQLNLFGAEGQPETQVPAIGSYRAVVGKEDLEILARRLAQSRILALDTETTGIDAATAELVGISITDRAGEAWYLPVKTPAGEPSLPLATIADQLGRVLADRDIVKRGHNLKFDMKMLERSGLVVKGPLFDTMIAEWVLNPDAALGLKSQAWTRLAIQMTEIDELIGQGKGQVTMDVVPLVQVVPYACADADVTMRLADELERELSERQQLELFRDLEMPLLPVLAEMELTGIQLDVGWLRQLSRELTDRLTVLEESIYRQAGGAFNINSTQQLSEILFDRLSLPTRGSRKTKSGHYSTRADVLESLQGAHPIVDGLLTYRELTKLRSTYVDALPDLVNSATGRVHTTYNPAGTVTGRISSNNPNLQNIPIRTDEGRRIRRAFVAQDGWQLMGADYSQVELRVMAHVSQDDALLDAFARDEDIHATTAAAVYDVALTEVTYAMRSTAKAVNFGLIYGQGAFGLARQIGVSVEAAQSFIDRYFERFPGVRVYMEQVQREAATKGYVETLLKRRRYFPDLAPGSSAAIRDRQASVRMAINTPIQGSAADIIKLAMIRMHRMLREANLEARMLLQVHDEVVLEVPDSEIGAAERVVREAMEQAASLRVALKVDVEVGPNWLDMKGRA